MVERQIVAKQDEAEVHRLEQGEQLRQRVDVLAVDLDQLERRRRCLRAVDRRMHRLDQRRFAHAARAPQKRVVGRQAGGEAPGIVDQDVADTVDAADQPDIDAVHTLHRLQKARIGGPYEAVRGGKIGCRDIGRRQPRYRRDQPIEFFGKRLDRLLGHGPFNLMLRDSALTCGISVEKHA